MPQPKCPHCSTVLSANAPEGLCPKCLIAAGLESQNVLRATGSASAAPTTPHAGSFVPPLPLDLAIYFPQLEILELLGHGGMGAVYKARQINLDRLIALKIIRPESAATPGFAERFSREAKTLGRLYHPHIVAVHDFGKVHVAEADGTSRPLYYFLMEFVDGANLRTLIQAGNLQPEQALAIVPQVCEALQYAHDEGIVHRDIKPENILLDKRGRVKIADFGLAKLVARSPEEFTLTGTHQVMGTPRYMAPEQMEGSHAVDHRADIYSLGVVFYELLTGEVPAGHFDPPSKKVEVDVRLDEVVLRSLAREPDRRYQHASEVKCAVESVKSLPPLSVPPLDPAMTPISTTSANPPRNTLWLAWDQWWAKRDRWLARSIQVLLVAIFLACLIGFAGMKWSVSQTSASPAQGAGKVRQVVVEYGLSSSPWSRFELNPGAKLGMVWRVNWISWSTALLILGNVAWCVNWQIEKAIAISTGREPRWWEGSPEFGFSIWGVVILVQCIWGVVQMNGS